MPFRYHQFSPVKLKYLHSKLRPKGCPPCPPTQETANVPRTFASLRGPSRPTIFPRSAAFTPSAALLTPSTTPLLDGAVLDLLPKISSHPALGAIQVRCGPRNTFNPSHFVRKRRHGFLSRIRTRTGRATLQRRRAKKRSTLSH